MILLDNNYRINTEDSNNCILEFFEIRTKNKDTEKEEQFEYVDQYFYSNVHDCLIKYLYLTQKSSKTVEEILAKTKQVESLIQKLNIK
jgi:23S rRNA maturation mini-RNase III